MSGLLYGSDDAATRGFRRIGGLLIGLVTVPTGLLLALGISMLVFSKANLNLLFGILVITLVLCVTTGIVLMMVFLRREATLSKLQMDFVSKVSHELKTPLTSIRMFVETLQMKRLKSPEEVDACLDVLSRETGRLTERIERLLDWGRMEAGRRIYDRQIETVPSLVTAALEAFHTSLMGRAVDVKVAIPAQVPEVLADHGAIVDALVNLLSNAYKYTPEPRDIAIVVTFDEVVVHIAVRDNGPGIPRRDQPRVFEKFYRIDERLSRDVEGSGLGLAIVRHIAQGHGGRVELESELGKGSTFTLTLPHLGPGSQAR